MPGETPAHGRRITAVESGTTGCEDAAHSMESSGSTEFDLLTQWCEGSDRAGDLLLRRCFPLLYRFFINKVGDATDDLVQQTLIACVRHRDKMLDSGAFRMYLLKIARSRLYDHLRALRRRAGHVDDDFEQVSVAVAGTSNTSRYGRAQAAIHVRDALRRLPVDLQLVVELHYWEDHSTAEIAELLELPQGTVKSRMRRAREALEADLPADAPALDALLGGAKPDVGTEANLPP
jgi:RNA polymerase sigma factor (sigma-70 family)